MVRRAPLDPRNRPRPPGTARRDGERGHVQDFFLGGTRLQCAAGVGADRASANEPIAMPSLTRRCVRSSSGPAAAVA